MGQIAAELPSNLIDLNNLQSKTVSDESQIENRAITPTRDKKGKWLEGKSGNPSGRPKTKPLTDAFKMALESPKLAHSIARDVLKKARRDARMLEQVLDRVEGKVVQQIDLNATIGIAERISRARTMQVDDVIEVEAEGE